MIYTLSMHTEKLNDIEVLLAYQEQKIQDLSDMVARQWNEIETLKKRLDHTTDKLKMIEGTVHSAPQSDSVLSVSEQAAMEKPPHY